MAGLLEKIEHSSIDRRRFVGLAATAGVAASLGLTGCDNKVAPVEDVSGAPTAEQLTGGEWVPFNCPIQTCGFGCYNKAYVADGIILRQGTDSHPDSPDFPQQRGCIKGRSTRRLVTAAERLKYPMKRKGWQPGGKDFKPELRGIDEWERISWDEATDLIASELTRIKEAYGNRAFLALGQSEMWLSQGLLGSALLNAIGGCLTTWGQASQGGFPVVSRNMRGVWALGMAEAQDRMALRHSKLIVLWGHNPTWSHSAGDMYHLFNTKKISGAKIIFIDPYFNPSMQALADQWIPCRPGTDGALLEAIAYEMITNDMHDQAFLDTHCVGFDSDHMPTDAKTNENFRDYILGVYDETPKTPEHASTACGTDPEIIRALAKEIATTKPVAWKSAGAPARTYYGNRYAQLFFTVGFMIGSVGSLGGEIAAGSGVGTCVLGVPGGANLVKFGSAGYKYPPNPICTETRAGSAIQNGLYDPNQEYGIAFAETFKAIVEGTYRLPGPSGQTRECDIRCIYRDNAHVPANQYSGGNWVEDAYRKPSVEFVVVNDLYLSRDAQYADILLPVSSTLEADYSCRATSCLSGEFAMMGRRVIEPYFESKFDPEIYFALCDKLGVSEEVMPRISIKQTEFNKLLGATVVNGSPTETESLVSVTTEDLEFYGVTGEPQEGRIPVKTFVEQGSYQVERSDNDAYMNTFDKAFVADPEANPLTTTSGKYEIYCQSLKDYYDVACFNDIDALPKYKPAVDGYEDKGSQYTYQLVSIHILRQAHSNYSQVRQLNEIFPNDLVMSEYDATASGFKKGDWVLASSSEGGKIARRLNVIPHLMPGVVLLGQGNWRAINQETGVDEGANANTVTRSQLLGDGYQGFNTVLLKIEPYSGEELLPDFKRPPLVPLSE
jgi:anaerobic dimethyl sulfoxide reductase subunit A